MGLNRSARKASLVGIAFAALLVGCESRPRPPLEHPHADSAVEEVAAGSDAGVGMDSTSSDTQGPGLGTVPDATAENAVGADTGVALDGGTALVTPVSTVIVLPDTQLYSYYYPDIYTAQTQWIVAQAKVRNIQAVLHVGDIVQFYDQPDEWSNASQAMRLLDGVVPYLLVPGNHDLPKDLNKRNDPSILINNYFAPQTMPWIIGTFETGRIENNYALFDIGPRKYLVIGLEWGPRSVVLQWADSVLKSFAAYPAILVTHAFLDGDSRYDWSKYPNNNVQYYNPHLYAALDSTPVADVNDGEEIYQKLIVPNPNVRMVFCGHVLGDPSYGAVGRRTDVRPDGTHIHQMLANYQVIPDGGDGYLRIVEFDSGKKEIRVSTYSPYLSELMSLPEAEATFTLPLDD
jgi:Calcineurin-like phosphoesterase